MRGRLLALALTVVMAAPLGVAAQALPDAVRAAGVTLADWDGVQLQVRRAAADKKISERALAGVCARMGIELAKHGHLELPQLVSLLSSKADEISALNQRLSLQAQNNDPATAALLQSARAAIDAGDLDAARSRRCASTTSARRRTMPRRATRCRRVRPTSGGNTASCRRAPWRRVASCSTSLSRCWTPSASIAIRGWRWRLGPPRRATGRRPRTCSAQPSRCSVSAGMARR